MHQILYIDTDEEITSTVDKLRKSSVKELFLAVPSRSIILQSLVNLKLLAREAEKQGKKIIIVTQDKNGAVLAEKCGIAVKSSMEGIEPDGEVKRGLKPIIEQVGITAAPVVVENKQSRERLKNIGSDGFFDIHRSGSGDKMSPTLKPLSERSKVDVINKKTIKKEEILPIPPVKANSFSADRRKNDNDRKSIPIRNDHNSASEPPRETANDNFPNRSANNPAREEEKGRWIDKKSEDLESLFGHKKPTEEKRVDKESYPIRSARLKKGIVIFVTACLLSVVAIAGYLFIPKSKINIWPKNETVEVTMELEGSANVTSVNFEERRMPVKLIEEEGGEAYSYNATGKGLASEQKARGTVTIYNEYNEQSQPLVATTRILSKNGKLFRLTKGVTVPGMSRVEGVLKAGAVEAEVIADQPGEEYNIGPDAFTIPGFEGSPKFSKFRVESSKAMVGGGSKGNEITVVSEDDAAGAKSESEKLLEDKMVQDIRLAIGSDNILLEDSLDIKMEESTSSAPVGMVANTFDYGVQMKAKAMAVSKKDLEYILKEAVRERGDFDLERYSVELIEIEYSHVSVDYESGSAFFRVNGKIILAPVIDESLIKKDLLGKREAEIKGVLTAYPEIDRLTIDFMPVFSPERISQFPGRVEIEVKKGSDGDM